MYTCIRTRSNVHRVINMGSTDLTTQKIDFFKLINKSVENIIRRKSHIFKGLLFQSFLVSLLPFLTFSFPTFRYCYFMFLFYFRLVLHLPLETCGLVVYNDYYKVMRGRQDNNNDFYYSVCSSKQTLG